MFMNGLCQKFINRVAMSVCLGCVLSMQGGCTVIKKGPVYVPLTQPKFVTPKMPPPAATRPSNANGPRAALLEVIEIHLPIGKFTRDAKVWKLLTKTPMSSRTAKLLADNGFKTGDGTFQAWPTIRKRINGPGVTSQAVYCQLGSIAPAVLNVHSNIRRQLLTYHTASESLVVRTYQNCDDAFLAAAGVAPKVGLTVVSLAPAVILRGVAASAGARPIGAQPQPGQARRVFPGVQFSFLLRPGHFIVLAPMHTGVLHTSIGSSFLTQQHHVPPRETVLLLVPLGAH